MARQGKAWGRGKTLPTNSKVVKIDEDYSWKSIFMKSINVLGWFIVLLIVVGMLVWLILP